MTWLHFKKWAITLFGNCTINGPVVQFFSSRKASSRSPGASYSYEGAHSRIGLLFGTSMIPSKKSLDTPTKQASFSSALSLAFYVPVIDPAARGAFGAGFLRLLPPHEPAPVAQILRLFLASSGQLLHFRHLQHPLIIVLDATFLMLPLSHIRCPKKRTLNCAAPVKRKKRLAETRRFPRRGLWWEKLDLNQRRPKPTDLQSAPFDQTQAFSHIGGPSRNRTRDAQLFRLPLSRLGCSQDEWLQGWELDPHRAAYEAAAWPICRPASVRPAALQAALLFKETQRPL